MFKQIKKLQNKRPRGQGMTEYIVVVALIGLAAILVFSYFGNAISGQTSQMTAQLAGNAAATAGSEIAKADSTAAHTAAGHQAGLDTFGDVNHGKVGN
jgi:type II secretory pathway pseudopilin PulG